jgi:uncharacterized protein (TIGR00255 family)
MTGFGLAEGAVGAGRMSVEIKTVNHRHFAAQFRLPSECQRFEGDMRERLRARIDRGHVSVAMRWTEQPTADGAVSVDADRARAVRDALQELASTLDMSDTIDLGFIARQPEVMNFGATDPVTVEAEPVLALIDAAAAEVLTAREREGDVLAGDLSARLDLIEARVTVVEAQAPNRVIAERDRLRAAVADLLDGSQLDESRLAQEIAFLADKLDITEEIVRLRSHLGAFRAALASNESPVVISRAGDAARGEHDRVEGE